MIKTLFVGTMEAQYKIWHRELEPLLDSLDLLHVLGNMVSCTTTARDKKNAGRNEAILKLTLAAHKRVPGTILMGRAEVAALNFPDQWTNHNSLTILRDSWLQKEPLFKVATVDKGRLLTSAGLTHGEWVKIGKPDTAVEAAARLNEKYLGTLYQGACYGLSGKPNGAANPIWADPLRELYPSWVLAEESCPFDQIHGGDGLSTFFGKRELTNEVSLLNALDSVSFRKFGSIVGVKDALFRCVSPGFTAKIYASMPVEKSLYLEKSKG